VLNSQAPEGHPPDGRPRLLRCVASVFPPIGERFEMLEETLQICEQMWSHNNGPFEGKHYRLAQTLCAPQPIQRPRPPILIGGEGEKETLRLVARYADMWNASLAAGPPDEMRHKLEVLNRRPIRQMPDSL
jgi:alkanesulfonate monooxygenase SsuD/methylene tetrahydromethanopterin reductase-like flavin-dependent oxidoreductase (luciferase family)